MNLLINIGYYSPPLERLQQVMEKHAPTNCSPTFPATKGRAHEGTSLQLDGPPNPNQLKAAPFHLLQSQLGVQLGPRIMARKCS